MANLLKWSSWVGNESYFGGIRRFLLVFFCDTKKEDKKHCAARDWSWELQFQKTIG